MKRLDWHKKVSAALWVAATMVLCACDDRSRSGDGSEKPVVVASIYPLASLAGQVLGEDVRVETLLPAGATPHGLELTADRLRMLAEADALLVVGRGLDNWALRAAERTGRKIPVLSMAEMVEGESLSPHHDHAHDAHDDHGDHGHGPLNPHVWLDPVRAMAFVEALTEEMSQRFPEHAQAIRERAERLTAELAELDAAYREQLADVDVKQLITFHNAFDLLAERYGLEVVAHLTPIELNPGAEVTPARLLAAVAAVERHGLSVVYAEPQFPLAAVAALQNQTGVAVMRLDPLGAPNRPGYATYQQMMRSNLQTLVQGQRRAQDDE